MCYIEVSGSRRGSALKGVRSSVPCLVNVCPSSVVFITVKFVVKRS